MRTLAALVLLVALPGLAQAKAVVQAQEKRRNELKTAKADLIELRRQLDTTQAERSMVSADVAELIVSRDTLHKEVAELRKQIDDLEVKKGQIRETAGTRVE